jgi:hypothetical protein
MLIFQIGKTVSMGVPFIKRYIATSIRPLIHLSSKLLLGLLINRKKRYVIHPPMKHEVPIKWAPIKWVPIKRIQC